MRYEAHEITIKYEYVKEHKGAHYTFDGIKFMNNGELHEVIRKSCLGLAPAKDKNTPFDKGSDIPELKESVKSARATLTSVHLGEDFETIKNAFLDRVVSEQFSWNFIRKGVLYTYIMDKNEFAEFIDTFGEFKTDRKVIRFPGTNPTMKKWFEVRV